MPRKRKGVEVRKPGPPRAEPTTEQRARLDELRDRAHQIYLLGEENELLRHAAWAVREAKSMVHTAMELRAKRSVSPERPGKEVIAEILALEKWERKVIDFRRKNDASPMGSGNEAELNVRLAEIAKYPEPVNARVRSALCLLRFADEMLRAEVGLAGVHEEVSLPGETEAQILDHLIEREFDLPRVAAVRLGGRPAEFEDAGRRSAERRGQRSKQVFDPLKKQFMEGFEHALRERGVQLDPKDEPAVDQVIRQAATQASADPHLDQQIPRVNASSTTAARPRRKREPE